MVEGMLLPFELSSICRVPYRIAKRRPGEIEICYADTIKAEQELRWKAKRSLDEMMLDSWRWQKINPNGYTQ